MNATVDDAAPVPAGSLRAKPWWPLARRVATWAFLALVAWLIVDNARSIDWPDVLAAMRRIAPRTLVEALVLVVASYALYSTFDLLGRRLTGHRLGTATVLGVTFVCYAFNLNLGSFVGSIGLRYRLYSRLGLDNDTITRIVGFSMLTNWFGYLALAGAVFAFGSIHLPPGWKIGDSGLVVVGYGLMSSAAAYLALCAAKGDHVWTIHGHEFETPSLRMALLQLAIAVGNWMLMGAVVWVLLGTGLAYPRVLAVLLVAAVAGLISHVPAGLGVLEAVFLALLGHDVPHGRLLGTLLAYRALYYLLPLAVATVFYVITEARARRLAKRTEP